MCAGADGQIGSVDNRQKTSETRKEAIRMPAAVGEPGVINAYVVLCFL
jgi:hypothetical protein